MVKSVLGVNHQALRDWLIQRVSAVMMAVYTLGLSFFFLTHSNMAYYEWHGLFRQNWMKIATLLVISSLLYHAWVGMWTVFTDYIKCAWISWIVQVLVLLGLFACFFETLLILWSV